TNFANLLIARRYKCRVFQDVVKTEWSTYLTLGSVTFDDILIASSLCYLLATSRTGFSSTDFFITRLVSYIISTGCLTSSFPALSMIEVSDSPLQCAVMPKNFIFLSIEFLVTKLYVNSFMALMNARYYLQADTNNVDSSEFRVRHGVYRPQLRVNVSQDEKPQTSRKDVSKCPDDEVLHTTRAIQAVMVGNYIIVGERGLMTLFSHSGQRGRWK
ncbi:hypothetical protein EDB19DRAFT_1645668, partial [Suillus lakei]